MLSDMEVVEYVSATGWFEPDLIPELYQEGVLRPFSPVGCSRWGIEFHPEIGVGDKRTMAIHESGHAVVYLEYGERFRHVEVDANDRGGELQPIIVKDVPGHTNFKKAQAISFAGGPIATSKLLYGNTTTWREGCLDDFLTMFSFEKINGYGSNVYVVREATRIIEEQWDVVEAIADHIVKFGRVRCAECMRIKNRVIEARS